MRVSGRQRQIAADGAQAIEECFAKGFLGTLMDDPIGIIGFSMVARQEQDPILVLVIQPGAPDLLRGEGEWRPAVNRDGVVVIVKVYPPYRRLENSCRLAVPLVGLKALTVAKHGVA